MNLPVRWRAGVGCVGALMILHSCKPAQGRADSAAGAAADSMGLAASDISVVPLRASGIAESSSATMSSSRPGLLFTINDSGNEAVLFAIDTSGAGRGSWRVKGATNVDWEATAIGPCAAGGARSCVYIGDVGDNDHDHPTRTIYRVPEPSPEASGARGDITAERLAYAYGDMRYDVEAMYVAPNGDMMLLTKEALRDAAQRLRPALVFRVPASAWRRSGTATAQLVDSLSLVPGSAPLRTITDAALSPDGKFLAVRTYTQVYTYATNASTGLVDHSVSAAVCDLVPLGEPQGEGITWTGSGGRLAFTSEGKEPALRLANCPLPGRR